MPKWDKTRDYYADLELPSNATIDEVKKQFKKLALKYHPDRNPGREAEVNPKFQIIQSAHEILIDAKLKEQYDEARRTYSSRFPKASGVRGNPWQDVGKQYQPPPTRRTTQSSTRPHSGAQRYSWANEMPRPPKPPPRDDAQSRKYYADAWENMRSHSTRRAPPQTPGRAPTSAARDANSSNSDQVPPKTAYQQQKAQASFGNSTRRTGFTPHSPGVADEPPVTSKNYFTTRMHSSLFTDPEPDATAASARPDTTFTPADPLAQFREKGWDERQSSPYHTPGGERTSLFDDGSGMGRTASTRSRRPEMPGAFPQARPRSPSTPNSSSNDAGSEDSTKANWGSNAKFGRGPANDTSVPQPRPSDRYKPNPGQNNAAPQPQQEPVRNYPSASTSASRPGGNSAQATNGPSLYATPTLDHPDPQQPQYHQTRDEIKCCSADKVPRVNLKDPSSGGVKHKSPALTQFEEWQKHDIDRIINSRPTLGHNFGSIYATASDGINVTNAHTVKKAKLSADQDPFSFHFSAGNEAPSKGTATEGLASPSTESINTRFVEDELPEGWQFSAGSVSVDEPQTPTKSRPQSRSRNRRQMPKTRQAETDRMPSMQEAPGNTTGHGFSAGEWSDKIGSQHFEPQPSRSASTSPTRRANYKKAKPVKMTAGTAGMVDDEESEGWQEVQPSANGTAQATTDSATAMDIDSPPPEKVDETPKASQTNGARKIPVEPYREEWRAGDVNGVRTKSASPAREGNPPKGPFTETAAPQSTSIPAPKPFTSQPGGSEDTEEFHTTLSDFKKVEPFADPSPRGLKDFGDLKSTLPFPSRPSEELPLEKERLPKSLTLEFPHPPVAPRLPPTVVAAGVRPNQIQFRKYAQDFSQYLEKWESFNAKILTHFETRQEHFKARRLRQGASWLDTPSGATDYLVELEQDQVVRHQWIAAYADHQAKIREFMMFRDQVK
ncbi:hypothetical protein F5Y05DRAFT_220604 [Hypoxylon sp. FL0543]|nr:hypothetical protein F5Y05DRAFT_220604 [Hypoxylon sp. FL0543]